MYFAYFFPFLIILLKIFFREYEGTKNSKLKIIQLVKIERYFLRFYFRNSIKLLADGETPLGGLLRIELEDFVFP